MIIALDGKAMRDYTSAVLRERDQLRGELETARAWLHEADASDKQLHKALAELREVKSAWQRAFSERGLQIEALQKELAELRKAEPVQSEEFAIRLRELCGLFSNDHPAASMKQREFIRDFAPKQGDALRKELGHV